MRARPRTWPSIRRKRLSTEAFAEVLANLCMPSIYPLGVCVFKAFMIVQQSAQSSGEIDPVCGMKVDPATSTYRHMHGERLYHFCSTGCLKKFMNQPEKFLSRRDRSPQTSHAGDLPDASADPADAAWQLPDLRHGAGARDQCRRYRSQS